MSLTCHGKIAAMSETRPVPAMASTDVSCEHRQVVYRVLPGSAARARRLASIAGACRFVWNELLDQQDQLHVAARMCGVLVAAEKRNLSTTLRHRRLGFTEQAAESQPRPAG